MSRAAVALPCIVALACASLPAYGQSAPLTTRVELDTPGMVLQATDAWANWHTRWTSRSVICAAPCVADVPLELRYRVVADEMPPSPPFSLPERDRVLLHVHPGSAGRHDAGAMLTLLGGITALVGTMVIWGNHGGKGGAGLGGIFAAGTGVAMMGIGIPMMLTSGTAVTFD
jgi:hypothetical protein